MSLYWKFGLAFAAFAALVSGCLMYGRQEYRRGEINTLPVKPINTTKPAMSGGSEYNMLKWKKSLKSLCIAAIALTMAACASSTKPLPTATELPPDLAQPCPDLPVSTGKDGKTVLRWAVDVVYLYRDCQARHRATVEATTVR